MKKTGNVQRRALEQMADKIGAGRSYTKTSAGGGGGPKAGYMDRTSATHRRNNKPKGPPYPGGKWHWEKDAGGGGWYAPPQPRRLNGGAPPKPRGTTYV